MKATVLKSVVLMSLVLASVFTANLSAKNVFVTNDEVKKEQVVSRTVYRLDEYLYKHMKYDYTYNEDGYISAKEAFKWNEANQSWTPYYRINLAYNNGEIVMDLARWNEKDNEYNLGKEQSVYQFNGNNEIMAYLNHKWSKEENEWKLVDNTSHTYNTNVFAIR